MAWAQREATAQAHIDAARRHYADLEYESALKELDLAHRRASTEEEKVGMLLLEGIILAEMGRELQASASFQAALRLRPDAQLPGVVSPKITQQFNALRNDSTRVPTTPEPKPQSAEKSLPPPQPRESLNSAAAPSAPRVASSGGRALRPGVLIPAVTGGALLIAGGISWGIARSEYSRLQNDAPEITGRADVDRTVSRGQTYQIMGWSLMGAGLVGLGIATGFYVKGEPGSPVTLRVGTDGTSAFLQGRWL